MPSPGAGGFLPLLLFLSCGTCPMTLGFSFCPLWMVKPRGGATTKAVSDRVCLPRLRMSSDGDFSTERLLKKIERAGLSLDMSEAVAQALQDADSLLAETRHATWNVRKGLEEESFLTLEAFRDRKDSSIDVDDMLREDEEEGEKENPYTFLMEECAAKAAKGLVGSKDVWAVLREMEDLGITPNTETYTSAVKALSKAAVHGKALPRDGNDIIEEMRDMGLTPTVVTASALLSLYSQAVKAGEKALIQDGWAVLRDLEAESGVQGDAYVYAGLMDLCAKLSKKGSCGLKDARQILAHMDSMGVHGDAFVYNSMLQVCSDGVRTSGATLGDGLRIFDKMQRRGVQPDQFTFSLLLSLAARSVKAGGADFEDAVRILAKPAEFKVKPNLVMFNSMLAVYVNGAERGVVGAEVMKSLISQLQREGIKADKTFYGSCMSLLAGASLHGKATGQDARDIVDKIRASGLAPSGETYRLWMKILGNEALLGKASAKSGLKVLEYIRSVGASPTASLYSTLMDLISRAALHGKGSVADAQRVFEDMRENEVQISEPILCSFLQVAKAEGSRAATMGAWSVFAGSDPAIRSQKAFTLLISALARSGQRKTAFALIDVLRSSGEKPNMYVYNAALSAAPDAEALLELFKKMQEDGIQGDHVTRKLVSAAKRGNKVYTTAPLPREVARKHVLKRLLGQNGSRTSSSASSPSPQSLSEEEKENRQRS